MQERQAREDHRRWIGGRAVTILNHYWRDDDPAPMTAALGKDWADVLEGMPQAAIEKACIQYQRDEPRRKPTPGAIYQLARSFMPRPAIVSGRTVTVEREQRERCAPEVAQAICEAAGYAPRKFGGDDK